MPVPDSDDVLQSLDFSYLRSSSQLPLNPTLTDLSKLPEAFARRPSISFWNISFRLPKYFLIDRSNLRLITHSYKNI